MSGATPALTERFLGAVSLAQEVHGHVRRSGTEIPYLAHLLRKRRYLAHLPEVRDESMLRVALADKVHNARSIVRDYREEGHVLWQRFTQKTAREQLWYYGGLLAFFQARRPGPLTEDLLRAVAELAWLVARDHAQRSEHLWLWVDPDLHQRQAPDGWVQVRTAGEAIALLDELSVEVISLRGRSEASPVVHWLTEQERRAAIAGPPNGSRSTAKTPPARSMSLFERSTFTPSTGARVRSTCCAHQPPTAASRPRRLRHHGRQADEGAAGQALSRRGI